MIAVLVGLLLTLGLSVGILVMVARPHLQQGSRILTPDGERLVRDAQRRSQEAARTARERILRDGAADGVRTAVAAPARTLVGRQRPSPVDSGPIPEVAEAGADAGSAGRVLDLTDGDTGVRRPG